MALIVQTGEGVAAGLGLLTGVSRAGVVLGGWKVGGKEWH